MRGVVMRRERAESKASVMIHKTAEGYEVTEAPISVELTRDGETVQDPLASLLQGITVISHVDEKGQLVRVEGFKGVAKKLAAIIGPEKSAMLDTLLGEEALLRRERAEWTGRYGDLAGLSVKWNETIDRQTPFTLPNGDTVEFHSLTSFHGPEDCPAGSCVWVITVFHSDRSALAGMLERVRQDQTDVRQGKLDGIYSDLVADLAGVSVRLVDPKTLRLYSERTSRRVSNGVQGPDGKGLMSLVKEERLYSFEYE